MATLFARYSYKWKMLDHCFFLFTRPCRLRGHWKFLLKINPEEPHINVLDFASSIRDVVVPQFSQLPQLALCAPVRFQLFQWKAEENGAGPQ